MNKYLLLAAVLCLFVISARSQTNVSGNISGNTTWTKAGSPYLLTGNVGVPAAYTLTVEPGVTIKRDNIYQILVNGAIQINGTPTDSINFENTPDLTEDSRFFIEFKKCNLNNSSLQYVSFQHNGGFTSHIRVGNMETDPGLKNSGTLLIKHSNLSNGNFYMWGSQTQASAQIDSCLINSALVDSYNEKINISNSQLNGSRLISGMYSLGINLTTCYANATTFRGTSFQFINSTVEQSRVENLGYNSNGIPNLITYSNFINSPILNSSGVFIASDSKFTATDDFSLSGSEDDYLFTADKLSMRNCQLINSSSHNIKGIFLGDANHYGTEGDTVKHNLFTDMYDAVTVNDFTTIILDSNNFSIPGRYTIVNQSPKDFSALYNYYQLKSNQTIDDVIFDQNDDLNYGLVTYTPYLTSPVVLPVALINFNGNAEGKTIVLKWQTSKEVNVSKFVIERRLGSDFTVVGTVSAAGNSGSINNYHFTDYTPAIGTNYYRLKTVDGDGRYIYSNVVPVLLDDNVGRLYVYPNPATAYVIIEHRAPTNTVQIELIDMSGRKVKTVIVAKGNTQTKMNIRGVAKGAYKIVWSGDTKTENHTLLIQ